MMSSILLFVLASAHAAITLQQLLDAFTNPSIAHLAHGSDTYFAQINRSLTVAQVAVYLTSVR